MEFSSSDTLLLQIFEWISLVFIFNEISPSSDVYILLIWLLNSLDKLKSKLVFNIDKSVKCTILSIPWQNDIKLASSMGKLKSWSTDLMSSYNLLFTSLTKSPSVILSWLVKEKISLASISNNEGFKEFCSELVYRNKSWLLIKDSRWDSIFSSLL